MFKIPRISSHNFDKLEHNGVVSMQDVPDYFSLIAKQQCLVDVAKSSEVIPFTSIDEIGAAPKASSHYLDFETFIPANPNRC